MFSGFVWEWGFGGRVRVCDDTENKLAERGQLRLCRLTSLPSQLSRVNSAKLNSLLCNR